MLNIRTSDVSEHNWYLIEIERFSILLTFHLVITNPLFCLHYITLYCKVLNKVNLCEISNKRVTSYGYS